jgi:hypothetical protein
MTEQIETPPAAEVETKNYEDGSSATGVAPLPDVSPEGAPAVTEPDFQNPQVNIREATPAEIERHHREQFASEHDPASHDEVANLASRVHGELTQLAGGTSHELGVVKALLEHSLDWINFHKSK